MHFTNPLLFFISFAGTSYPQYLLRIQLKRIRSSDNNGGTRLRLKEIRTFSFYAAMSIVRTSFTWFKMNIFGVLCAVERARLLKMRRFRVCAMRFWPTMRSFSVLRLRPVCLDQDDEPALMPDTIELQPRPVNLQLQSPVGLAPPFWNRLQGANRVFAVTGFVE